MLSMKWYHSLGLLPCIHHVLRFFDETTYHLVSTVNTIHIVGIPLGKLFCKLKHIVAPYERRELAHAFDVQDRIPGDSVPSIDTR